LKFKFFTIVICITLSSLSSANEQLRAEFEKTAASYSQAVGSISFREQLIVELNKQCSLNLQIDPSFKAEADYLIRKKTNYTFDEFVDLFEQPSQITPLLKEAASNVLKQTDGCVGENINSWYELFYLPNYKDNLFTLNSEEPLYGLPPKIRSDSFLLKELKRKTKDYKHLPKEEINGIAEALSTGFYWYTMSSGVDQVPKDINKALELRTFIANTSVDPKTLYDLARVQQKSDRKTALESYKKSAELGYNNAEIWVGTYYACNSNKLNALLWLNKAKPSAKDPDYVGDIIMEVKEQGMPTNCLDGWVY